MTEYTLTGNCCQCGQCCKASFISKVLCQNNNIIDGELYCDFIEKQPDGKFYCQMIVLAKTADETIDISQVLDPAVITSTMRTELDMTDKQAEYCCGVMAFPDLNVQERWKRVLDEKEKYKIPKCTFSYEGAA